MSLGGFIVTLLDQPKREANIVTGLYLLSSTPELKGRRLHGRMIRLDRVFWKMVQSKIPSKTQINDVTRQSQESIS